jgi:hypothetical protein
VMARGECYEGSRLVSGLEVLKHLVSHATLSDTLGYGLTNVKRCVQSELQIIYQAQWKSISVQIYYRLMPS